MLTTQTATTVQAFGVVETLHNPTPEEVEAVIEAMKDHADMLLDWWNFEQKKNGSPNGNLDGFSITATDFEGGVATVAMRYYFRSDRFREVRYFIKYQELYAPKWHYDPI